MKLSPSCLRDQLGNADRARVAVATFTLMDGLQKQSHLTPGEALAALAAGFILAVEVSELSLADVLTQTKNLIGQAYGRRAEFIAAATYLEKEVL